MPTVLPRLREDLDFLPSPLPERPGLLLRDPFRYSEVSIILPPPLVPCLTCFDGAHTDIDLNAMVFRETGRLDSAESAGGLTRGLSDAGFLDDDVFRGLRAKQHDVFARSAVRQAAFVGGGYPANRSELARTVETWLEDPSTVIPAKASPPLPAPILAIAAPHVSPTGGVSSYGAAYRALGAEHGNRTVVILGTSHYGRPNSFGLTRKPFATPLGETTTDVALVDQLERAAPDAVVVEDYCHAVEHSIEFQVLFLQTLFGPGVRILPVLCGPFVGGPSSRSAPPGSGRPEDDSGVARMIGALGQLRAHQGSGLLWVLGVDMAHMGRRYGDPWEARAHDGPMKEVAARDHARLERVIEGDADGFWDALHERGHDDLKWCGSAPLYAFLRAHPGVRGRVLNYDQWNIDDQSVVSFGALAFCL